jgi:nitroreductase
MNLTLGGDVQEFWVQDCSAATENILLAAHSLGLGAVWCGVYPNKERAKALKTILSLPENIVPLNIISIGVREKEQEPKDKWKEEKINWNKW